MVNSRHIELQLFSDVLRLFLSTLSRFFGTLSTMPPIPVYIDDPIVPQKAQGATQPAPEPRAGAIPSNNPSTTTQDVSSVYPPARPGAPAAPAPTGFIPRPAPDPTRTQPQVTQDQPPPPQPGAVPVPMNYQQAQTSTGTPLVPPPRPGEAPRQQYAAMPSQMQMPPPSQNYAPTHSTMAGAPVPVGPQGSGPTTLNFGPVAHDAPSDHPPGYQQNTYAQDLNPAQRSGLDVQERKESIVNNLGGETAGEAAENVWNAVKNWASVAGEKLAETEESVWKRINGH